MTFIATETEKYYFELNMHNIWCEDLIELKMPFPSSVGNQLYGTKVLKRINFQLEQILVTEINEEQKGGKIFCSMNK